MINFKVMNVIFDCHGILLIHISNQEETLPLWSSCKEVKASGALLPLMHRYWNASLELRENSFYAITCYQFSIASSLVFKMMPNVFLHGSIVKCIHVSEQQVDTGMSQAAGRRERKHTKSGGEDGVKKRRERNWSIDR